jgi:hypothetical protein
VRAALAMSRVAVYHVYSLVETLLVERKERAQPMSLAYRLTCHVVISLQH